MHFSSLLQQLSQLESDVVSCSVPTGEKDVLLRQTRVIRLFMQDEQECRANFGTFHAFSARVSAWLDESVVAFADKDVVEQFRAFVLSWSNFYFIK